MNACGEFHTEAAGIAVNALAHMRQQFFPFCEPEGAGLAAVMAKRDHTDDAENSAISRIISICAVVDVVFWRDGGVSFGDIRGFSAMAMVVQDADAAEFVASVGFKYRKVVWIRPNGAALDEHERVCITPSVLHVDDAETFVWHGVGLAFRPATF